MRRVRGPIVAAITLAVPAAHATTPTDAHRADRALVADLIADAAWRSSLLAQPTAGAGHDGGFVIVGPASGAGLEVTGWSQIRYTLARAGETRPPADDFDSGFSLRRTRLTLQGRTANGRLGFKVTHSFRAGGGASRLSDGFVTARLAPGAELRVGQFKLPFAREELTSAKRLLATDRSITNDVFGQDRGQGVELALTRGDVSATLAFSDGFDSDNTDLPADPADWALTGRVEWAPVGSARAFRDFSSPRGSAGAGLLGVAGHVERTPDTPLSRPMTPASWAADAGLEGDGWHVFAAAIGRSSEAPAGTFHDLGVVASASVFVTDAIEAFARFDAVLPDGDRPLDGAFRTLTLGGTWFRHGHSLKVTLDARVFLDDLDDTSLVGASESRGLLAGARAGSFAVRAQIQFVF